MKKAFKLSLRAAALSILAFFALLVMATFTYNAAFYDLLVTLAGMLICASPLLFLSLVVTGIGTLVQGSSSQEKYKRHYVDSYEPGSKRMRRILAQLPPDDRAFLEQELAARKLGISDDGEMVTLDDLLSDDFSHQKRK